MRIEPSNVRVFRFMSERMNLGPEGPSIIFQSLVTLVMVVAMAVWAVDRVAQGRGVIAILSPFLVAGFIALMLRDRFRRSRAQLADE